MQVNPDAALPGARRPWRRVLSIACECALVSAAGIAAWLAFDARYFVLTVASIVLADARCRILISELRRREDTKPVNPQAR